MNTKSALASLLAAVFLGITCGCEQPSESIRTHEDLDAALWVHTSAEYRAITEGVYRAAREKLALAIKDPTWSAVPSQQDELQNGARASELPAAVIMDVDETVLSNIPFQARMIDSVSQYNREAWNAWVDEAAATLIPGAEEFIKACAANDVTVFFVTNRRADIERGTRRNLESLEVLAASDPDTILSKYERDGWTTDKASRRQFVATRYRVLLLLGDDLNDFVWVDFEPTAEERCQAASAHQRWWGHKWFMLPNPNYGGWERALYGFDDELSRDEILQQKQSALPQALAVESANATGSDE